MIPPLYGSNVFPAACINNTVHEFVPSEKTSMKIAWETSATEGVKHRFLCRQKRQTVHVSKETGWSDPAKDKASKECMRAPHQTSCQQRRQTRQQSYEKCLARIQAIAKRSSKRHRHEVVRITACIQMFTWLGAKWHTRRHCHLCHSAACRCLISVWIQSRLKWQHSSNNLRHSRRFSSFSVRFTCVHSLWFLRIFTVVTQCFATFLLFCAPKYSFLWLFLFSDLLSSSLLFSDSSHLCFSINHLSILSELCLRNFLRS